MWSRWFRINNVRYYEKQILDFWVGLMAHILFLSRVKSRISIGMIGLHKEI
jgi:hypothetical protein